MPLTTAVEVVVATAKAVEGWLGLEVAGRCSRGRHGSGLGGLQELGVPERSQLGRMVVAAATEVDRDSGSDTSIGQGSCICLSIH